MRQDRKAREKMLAGLARDSLKNHVILQRPNPEDKLPRWQIGQANGSSIYRAEVIITYQGGVIVHGDIDLVHFQAYHGPGGARGIIQWVAESNLNYLTSKAAIGTGSAVAWCYDPDVALDDALSYAEEGEKNPEDYRTFKDRDYPNEPDETWSQRWRQIAERIEDGDHEHAVAQLVYDKIEDSEYCDIGKCPAPRVAWAWRMARKLHELLEAEEKANG
jgi:hypothetical protein